MIGGGAARAEQPDDSPSRANNAHREELPGFRDATSNTYQNPDGTFTTEIFDQPVNYRADDRSWRHIDSSLVPVSGDYDYSSGANSFDAAFKNSMTERFMRFRVGDRDLELSLSGAAPSEAEAHDESIVYDDVLPGVSAHYGVLPTGVKETLVLDDPTAQDTFTFDLATSDELVARSDHHGGWAFYDDVHEAPLFLIEAPSARDASGLANEAEAEPQASPIPSSDASSTPEETATRAPTSPESPGESPSPTDESSPTSPTPLETQEAPITQRAEAAPDDGHGNSDHQPDDHGRDKDLNGRRNASLDVKKTDGGFKVTLGVDRKWLEDPDRVFPVSLDPTMVVQPSDQDASFDASCAACPPLLVDRLNVGTDQTHVWRSAVRFNLSSIPSGVNVVGAQTEVFYDKTCITSTSQSCAAQSHVLAAHAITAPWSTSSTSSDITFGPAFDTQTVPTQGDARWISMVSANVVRDWLAGTRPNYGVLLKRTDETLDAGGVRPFSSRYVAEPALRPRLVVTWQSTGVTLDAPSVIHANGAELNWSEFVDGVGTAFSRYEVHRSTSASFTPSASTLIATIGDRKVTSYRDTTAAPGQTYTYKIAQGSDSSNAQTVTLPADGKTTEVIQPGAKAGKDTYIVSSSPSDTHNFGASQTLSVGNTGTTKKRAFLRFNLGEIPGDATIDSAQLSLYHPDTAVASAQTVQIRRATSSWSEGTGDDTVTGDGATWTDALSSDVQWDNAGGDFDTSGSPDATASMSTNESAAWSYFDVLNLVRQWTSGSKPNLGVAVKLADETQAGNNVVNYISSHDGATSIRHPKLTITFDDGSHSKGPLVAIAEPGPGTQVSGSSVRLAAAASDDSRVDHVTFSIDGAPVGTAAAAPYAVTWNSTQVANGNHSLTATAYDDVGNQTISDAFSISVANYTSPSASITTPGSGSTVSGTVTVTAAASAQAGVSKVEFFADGLRIDPAATAPPYSVSWNTLSSTQPAYDGSHTLTAVVTDAAGQTTTSAPVSVTVDNRGLSKYKAQITRQTSDAIPQEMTGSQSYNIGLSVKNTSLVPWTTDIVLRYRWFAPDGSVVATSANQTLPATALPAGGTGNMTVSVAAPTMPNGNVRTQDSLVFDLFEVSSGTYFASKGNEPLAAPVVVDKNLNGAAGLGFERFYAYQGEDIGAGMSSATNVANGNMLLSYSPFAEPGKGLSTVLNITYNSLEDHTDSPLGNNFSLQASSPTRFGIPLDIHPQRADTVGAGNPSKFIQFVDGDGTLLRFVAIGSAGVYDAPPGVHLYLREVDSSTGYVTKKYAMTRPDGVTFYYDTDGYPTEVKDINGNRLQYSLQGVAPGDDYSGLKKHIMSIKDEAGIGAGSAPERTVSFTYYDAANAPKAPVRGRIRTITDHLGHVWKFAYYDDGNLLSITQVGGTRGDGSFLANRKFIFTYTTPTGAAPSIPDRTNPSPSTGPQSARLYSVIDPRGNETKFAYFTANGSDKWKLQSRTDRRGKATTFAYDVVNKVTTVTGPLSRQTKFTYDASGRPISLLDPASRTTAMSWSTDNMLTQLTEPGGAITTYDYNANGYLTSQTDQVGNKTVLDYANSQADANDTTSSWPATRSIPHISRLSVVTRPKGVATTGNSTDYQWRYGYDTPGNLVSVTDPENNVTTITPNTDGTTASITDANSHVTQFSSYDANGLPTTIVDAKGQTTKIGYNDAGSVTFVQDPEHAGDTGSQTREYRTVLDYDSFNRLDRQSAPRSTKYRRGLLVWSGVVYDANDNVVTARDPALGLGYVTGPATTTAYDEMDRATDVTTPNNGGGAPTTHYTYDDAGRITSITRPNGVATPSIDKDYATFYDYDALDRVKTETEYEVDSQGSIVSTMNTYYCYSTPGDLIGVVAPKANLSAPPDCSTAFQTGAGGAPGGPPYSTKYSYYADHTLKTEADGENHMRKFVYDADGNLASSTDAGNAAPGNAITTYDYDQRDFLVQKTEPLTVNSRSLFTKYVYDGVGNLRKEISPQAYDASSDKVGFGEATTYNYDAVNQLVSADLPVNGATTAAHVYYDYDSVGNLKTATLPVTDVALANVAPENKTDYRYYDTGEIYSSDDHVNAMVRFDYDASGRQVLRDPIAASVPGDPAPSQRTVWSYYPNGQLEEVGDRSGSSKRYTYDLDGNLKSASNGAGVLTGSESRLDVDAVYDSLDRPTKISFKKLNDASQTYTAYTYDLNSNVATRVDDGGSASAHTTTMTYDKADWVVQQVDDRGTTSMGDDQKMDAMFTPNGLQKLKRISIGGVIQQSTDWTYYDNGLLKTLQTRTGESPTWSSTVTPGTIVESHTVSYVDNGVFKNGNRTSDTYYLTGPSGQATACPSTNPCSASYTYDARDRLTNFDNGRGATGAYTLDARGNVKSKTTSSGGAGGAGQTTTYTYSGTRLDTSDDGSTPKKYIYDIEGNLDCVVKNTSLTACPARGSSTLVNDYSYDYLNRLTSYSKWNNGSKTDGASYTYDALDRLSKQSETHGTSAKTTSFTYQGLTNLITQQQESGSSNATKKFSYDAFGNALAMTNGPDVYTYGYDVHGSVSLLLQRSGTVTGGNGSTVKATYSYDAYGNPISSLSKGDDADANNPLNPLRYSGRRIDTGSNTIDMGARRFGPDIQSFLQRDLYQGALDDLNLTLDPLTNSRYNLAGGNPASFVEFDGHYPLQDGGGKASHNPRPSGNDEGASPSTPQHESVPSSNGTDEVRGYVAPHPDRILSEEANLRVRTAFSLGYLKYGKVLDQFHSIVEAAEEFNVNPRVLAAIIINEGRGRQGYNELQEKGAEVVEALQVARGGNPSIGIGEMQLETFRHLTHAYPNHFGGFEASFEQAAYHRLTNEETAIRYSAAYIDEIAAHLPNRASFTDSRGEVLSQSDLVAFGYNAGVSEARAVASGASSPASLNYIRDFRESYAFADSILTPLGY